MHSLSRLASTLDRYFRWLSLAAGAALIVMMLVTVADVFMRYVFNSPVRGSYELVEICLLISVFFALPQVIANSQEIVIDLIDGLMSPGAVNALKSIAAFATAAVLLFLLWSMLQPATEAYSYGDVKLELDFPVWILWSLALFGLANSVIASLFVLSVRHSDDPRHPPSQDHAE
ncbi:TRAP transporter small permease [Rhizobium sp. SL86]|uniref:TRAP transporter small permease n=1 Tax=Rhizobium sp. SL86 TaxID=2995148 RepID=UPI0022765C2D|nr:TRAP transporter small permease [Rhizobium sp. SL86]MCY1666537.1 TRAP transporter small permease [Rhizobium sp. SL86]